jgi:hypothetical protein
MKVKIGKYPSWFGPYQLADVLCFWAKDKNGENPDWVHNFGEWLAYGSVDETEENREPTIIYKILLWIDERKSRKIKVKIDSSDLWDLSATLSHIILPALVMLREKKHGSPFVLDEDVPEEIRSTNASPKENEWDTDEFHHDRWDYVLNEMIWAFNELASDNEPSFLIKEGEIIKTVRDDGLVEIECTSEFDHETRQAYEDRKRKAFMYFGKYYQALWD